MYCFVCVFVEGASALLPPVAMHPRAAKARPAKWSDSGPEKSATCVSKTNQKALTEYYSPREAERAAEIIDSKLKEQEAEETDVAMRVMAANNDLEAEAAAKRKNEMYKKILGKEAFDAEEEGRKVQELLTEQHRNDIAHPLVSSSSFSL